MCDACAGNSSHRRLRPRVPFWNLEQEHGNSGGSTQRGPIPRLRKGQGQLSRACSSANPRPCLLHACFSVCSWGIRAAERSKPLQSPYISFQAQIYNIHAPLICRQQDNYVPVEGESVCENQGLEAGMMTRKFSSVGSGNPGTDETSPDLHFSVPSGEGNLRNPEM